MSWRFPGSLRLTVPLILLVFAAALSAFNLLYHVPRAESAAEEDGYKRLTQEMSRLQSTLEYLLLKGSIETAQHEIAVLAHNHDFTLVALTDDRNRIIATTRRALLGREVVEAVPRYDMALAVRAVLDRHANVVFDPTNNALVGYAGILMGSNQEELRPTRAGNLYMTFDLNRSKAEARAQVLQQSLYWAGWVTALALALWLVFHFLLTRRTALLVRAAEQIAAGNLDARSALRGHDELARLSRAFDAMAASLKADLDERKRAEEALRLSEESYRTIFDAAEDAIFVHDVATGAVLDVNPKACISYGYTREQLLSIPPDAFHNGKHPYTPEDVKRLKAALAGENQHFERHGQRPDGSERWDEAFLKRVTINGQARILGLTREITDRKSAEAALRASEEQYRSMFNASIDGLVLWNAAGEIVDINPALSKMYGYTQEEFAALPPRRFIDPAFHPDFLPSVATGTPWHAEFNALRKDGSALSLEVNAIPMQYQGQPHMLTIARDITEKKLAGEELARQREALYQREKLAALGSLLAGVAHELNNPLSVVVARAVLLEEQGTPASQTAAQKIRSAAERCARIVRTFLAMARQQPPERGPVQINDLITAALDIAGYAVRTSGIEMVLELGEGIPPILADADQLHQVLLNLIINAQHALQEQQQPRRMVITSRYDDVIDEIQVSVVDNGPGVPEALRARVFEPFFTTKPMGLGTGVGLAVSFGIVEAHGGSLTLDCPEGGGAAFTISLPVGSIDANGQPVDTGAHSAKGLRKVLIVDDEAEIRDTLSDILTSARHRVDAVSSGREALDLLADQYYDVILTDIHMPDFDGRALYREIEQRWAERVRRVVFVTGDTLAMALREFAADHGRPIIEKPFLPAEVRRVVAEVAAQSDHAAWRAA